MKILVFSDSHGQVGHMERAVREERPDRVLHLGDVLRDAGALARTFPALGLECVPGNCDAAGGLPEERLLELEGRRILMMHGHTRGVKAGIGRAVLCAREAGADVLAFGHTHEPLCDRVGELWILNPGSVRGGYLTTYGVITLGQGRLACRTVRLDGRD